MRLLVQWPFDAKRFARKKGAHVISLAFDSPWNI